MGLFELRDVDGAGSMTLRLDDADPAIKVFAAVACFEPDDMPQHQCPAPERTVDSIHLTRVFQSGKSNVNVAMTIELGRLRTLGANNAVYMRDGYWGSLDTWKRKVELYSATGELVEFSPGIWGPTAGLKTENSTPEFLFAKKNAVQPDPDILWICRPDLGEGFGCESIIEDFAPLYVRYGIHTEDHRFGAPLGQWVELHANITEWVADLKSAGPSEDNERD